MTQPRPKLALQLLALVSSPIALAALLGACGNAETNATTSSGAAGPAGTGGGDTASSSGNGFGGNGPHGPYDDFPTDPVIDDTGGPLPADIGTQFGDPSASSPDGGPCLMEPQIGALFPNNWLRPRFRMVPPAEQNVFEIRIHTAGETNDLVVYTASTEWKMTKDMWTLLLTHLQDVPMTLTIRGAKLVNGTIEGTPSVGSTGDITIAPASAEGSIVFWHTLPSENSGELKGFTPGDEGVTPVLTVGQIQAKPQGQSVTCLGCHASTPDGKYAAFKTLGGTNGDALASVEMGTPGDAPSFWSNPSIDSMAPAMLGIPTFSKGHWSDGDHVVVTSFGNGQSAQLAWFDLEATASGQGVAFDMLARTGDDRGAIMPAWSHDGSSIVYTSTNGSGDGRPTTAETNLVSIPYANKAGGTATPIAGAATDEFSEYYPALSPDDQLIAFNRIGAGVDTYNQPAAEVFVIPTAGGTPERVLANDPPTCSGVVSPGITNSWPKWAPESTTVGTRTFYWLIFSSRRGDGAIPQLYVSAVVSDNGTLTTYPALYLWNQAADEANHTPAWDVFKIPDMPPQ